MSRLLSQRGRIPMVERRYEASDPEFYRSAVRGRGLPDYSVMPRRPMPSRVMNPLVDRFRDAMPGMNDPRVRINPINVGRGREEPQYGINPPGPGPYGPKMPPMGGPFQPRFLQEPRYGINPPGRGPYGPKLPMSDGPVQGRPGRAGGGNAMLARKLAEMRTAVRAPRGMRPPGRFPTY